MDFEFKKEKHGPVLYIDKRKKQYNIYDIGIGIGIGIIIGVFI